MEITDKKALDILMRACVKLILYGTMEATEEVYSSALAIINKKKIEKKEVVI